MSVTIQDVLDANGDIFGLPVVVNGEIGFCSHSKPDAAGDVGFELKRAAMSSFKWLEPDNIKVRADGIRVLEIDGRLYRVTGHVIKSRGFDIVKLKTSYYASDVFYEPLAPDKPSELKLAEVRIAQAEKELDAAKAHLRKVK